MIKILRNYQQDALQKLENKLIDSEIVVLGAAPNSGKTLIAMKFIKKYPNKKFLILPHGTKILDKQWATKLNEEGILFNQSSFGSEKVTLGLPQSIKNRAKEKIDFLIVDEAHHFYNASMVKEIIENCQPDKQILLTGSPSKFIDQGHTIVPIATEILIENKVVSDLYVGVASTSEIIKQSNYDVEGNLRSSYKFKNTEESMNNLLDAIIDRLRSTVTKGKPLLNKATSWVKAMGQLHKTMIACNSIKQANEIFEYLNDNDVKALISHSENDIKSENFEKFKNTDYSVLIVVDRGILGFDYPELVNVIDMTFSQNIDSIFQLYSRAIRVSDKFEKKYFFKISTENEMILTKFYLEASLCMMHEEFYTKYNGKNLDGMRIPILKSKKQRRNAKTSKSNKAKTLIERPISIDPLFYETVSSSKLMIDIIHKIDLPISEYAYSTMGELKNRLKGIGFRIVNPKERRRLLLDFFAIGKKPDEKLNPDLYRFMIRTINCSQEGYDKEIDQLYIKLFGLHQNRKFTDESATEILKKAQHRTFTEFGTKNKGVWTAVRKRKKEFPIFWKTVEEMYPNKQDNDSNKTDSELESWILKNQRLPRQHVNDANESRLAALFNNRKNSIPGFRERWMKLGFKIRNTRVVKCVETGEIFESVAVASKKINHSHQNIHRSAKNGTKCGGFHWIYIE